MMNRYEVVTVQGSVEEIEAGYFIISSTNRPTYIFFVGDEMIAAYTHENVVGVTKVVNG